MLDNTSNQPFKFKTKNWVEINDDSICTYDKKNITFKTAMLIASLCSFSNAYKLVEVGITIVGKGADDAAIAAHRNNK